MTTPSIELSDSRLRRFAGVGALLYVAAFVASMVLIGQPTVHEGQEGIDHSFVEASLGQVYAGLYILAIGFLALLPTTVYLANALGRRTALGAWAAKVSGAAAVAYIVVIVGVGFSSGAASLWGFHHDLDLPTVLAINNVRNFAYFAAMPLMGLFSLAVGIAAITDRVLTRWVGWGGIIAGVAFLLAVPAAAVGIQFAMPLWLLWWLGTGISLMREPRVAWAETTSGASDDARRWAAR